MKIRYNDNVENPCHFCEPMGSSQSACWQCEPEEWPEFYPTVQNQGCEGIHLPLKVEETKDHFILKCEDQETGIPGKPTASTKTQNGWIARYNKPAKENWPGNPKYPRS